MRELDFIRWITSQEGFDPSAVPVGPGDDAAVVRCGDSRIVVTADQVIDGVHARLADCGPEALGRKAMARNLSDLAAMAARPLCAVATVALPPGADQSLAEGIYQGIRELGDAMGCPLVGGDLASGQGPVLVSLTAIGTPDGIEPVLRSGGRAGDVLLVTGRLGGAWRTQRHLTFTPRVTEARTLAERFDLHAMIDLSDGLATDLGHLCRASGLGAELDAADIPLQDGADLHAALTDGEDYELLLARTPESGQAGFPSVALAPQGPPVESEKQPVPLFAIGRLVEGEGITLITPEGRTPLDTAGWEHHT
jgi:thiamine-monophosphate kinase